MEIKTKESLISYLTETATAVDEEATANWLSVFNPTTDRDTMGEVYTAAIGYNPIKHFDINDIISVVEDVTKNVKVDQMAAITFNKDRIVKRAMEIYEAARADNLAKAVAESISEVTNAADASKVNLYLTGSESIQMDDDDCDDIDDGTDLVSEMEASLDDTDDDASLTALDDDPDYGIGPNEDEED